MLYELLIPSSCGLLRQRRVFAPSLPVCPQPGGWSQSCSSQRNLEDNKDVCFLVLSFSQKHLSAERNYDVGYWELLPVKVVLQEWRQWLEGAEQPYLVWMDSKNLEYIRGAKRLNSR